MFKEAVGLSVDTPVDNVIINKKTEVTTARRVSRKLLATVVEIDFSVKVVHAAAATALIASDKLSKGKLDAQLILQVIVRVHTCIYKYVWIHAYTS